MEYSEGITWLRIRDRGWNKTYYLRRELHSLGYQFDQKRKEWMKQQQNDADLDTATHFCKKHGFRLIIDLPQFRRSSVYRKLFIKNNPGLFHGRFYFCAYCGTLMKPEQMTVDHLISIKAAQDRRFFRWILKKLSIDNINDPKNLVPACEHCNKSKGTKSGLWLIRGLCGRHPMFWYVFWIAVFVSFIFAVSKIKLL